MAHKLNIGKRGNRRSQRTLSSVYAPRPSDQGIHDGRDGTPDVEMLCSAARLEYLNGYQCGFRERKAPPWPRRDQWMYDSFIAMFEPRDPNAPPPVILG